jgi:ABC-type multidrug transport system ATPase subunit
VLSGQSLGRAVGGRTLFDDVSFDVAEGLLWIRGPSGSGKTELLRRVAELVEGAGTVSLDGVTAGAMGLPVWRSRVVYVPQSPPRLASTGADAWERVRGLSVQQSRPFDDPRALAASWHLRPGAWDQPMRQLSGGEAQRLWLAVCLATRPDAVLLDEPTSALDPEAVAAVEASLTGRLGLLVTHSVEQGSRLCAAERALG